MKIEYERKEQDNRILVIKVFDQTFKEVFFPFFKKHLKTLENTESLEDLASCFDNLEYKAAKRYCIYLLSLKNYPEDLLKDKLKKKLVSEKSIQLVLEDLRKYGYVNDQEWIERFLQKELKKGYGPKAIFGKLKQKSVGIEKIEKALELLDEQPQIEGIIRLLQKKFSKDLKNKLKAMQFLQRRGFAFFVITKAVNLYFFKTLHDPEILETE